MFSRKKQLFLSHIYIIIQTRSSLLFLCLVDTCPLSILCPVDTCPVIDLLLCFFAHCHVKAFSFRKVCVLQGPFSLLCVSCCNSLFPQPPSHVSLSNCRISPHHLILLNSKTFFSLFHFSCIRPDFSPLSLPSPFLCQSSSKKQRNPLMKKILGLQAPMELTSCGIKSIFI